MQDFKPRFYPEAQFGGFTHLDGTVAFYTRVHAVLPPSAVVLDVGCGPGDCRYDSGDLRRRLRNLRSEAGRVIGIDVDPEGESNPFIDEFKLIESGSVTWPITASSIDLILCDWVLEHLEYPDSFFSECSRVLTPTGYLCLRTTNRLGYVGLISSLMPNRFHSRIANPARGLADARETYKTWYRCNTPGKLRRSLTAHHFDGCVCAHEAEPSYLNFSYLAYGCGVLYQRYAPRYFGNTLLAFAQKTALR